MWMKNIGKMSVMPAEATKTLEINHSIGLQSNRFFPTRHVTIFTNQLFEPRPTKIRSIEILVPLRGIFRIVLWKNPPKKTGQYNPIYIVYILSSLVVTTRKSTILFTVSGVRVNPTYIPETTGKSRPWKRSETPWDPKTSAPASKREKFLRNQQCCITYRPKNQVF